MIAQLKSSEAWKLVSTAEKTAWKSRLEGGKKVYEWILSNLDMSPHGVVSMPSRGRAKHVQLASVEESSGGEQPTAPSMDLRSTARFFLERMSAPDRKELATTLHRLDGCTLRVGSTCSGTDVCANVFRHTFAALCLLHNVSQLN